MSKFSLNGRDGRQITDWRSWTRPKAENHWRAGRSAMELARIWFTSPLPVCPPEVRSLLETHPEAAGLVLSEGWPEFVTALPERGEGRNHDILLLGSHAGSGVVVSVEAKVDEQYGKCIGDYWQSAHNSRKPTRAPERIEVLLSIVFGANARPDTEPWASLRYQLLTAVSGTAIEAARREVGKAVVIVHEILTESADASKVTRNAQDFSDFVYALLSRDANSVQPGHVYGPMVLGPNKDLSRAVNVFIGKAEFNWQSNDI